MSGRAVVESGMYHGSGPRQEGLAPRRLAPVFHLGAVLVAGLCLAGCSVSVPMGSLVADQDLTTASTGGRQDSPLHASLNPEDWRRARAALGVALDPQGSGASVSWDNPDSGAKGSFTPVGQPFVQDDAVCRAFLAALQRHEAATLQGTACRPSGGEWTIKDVRPFNRAT